MKTFKEFITEKISKLDQSYIIKSNDINIGFEFECVSDFIKNEQLKKINSYKENYKEEYKIFRKRIEDLKSKYDKSSPKTFFNENPIPTIDPDSSLYLYLTQFMGYNKSRFNSLYKNVKDYIIGKEQLMFQSVNENPEKHVTTDTTLLNKFIKEHPFPYKYKIQSHSDDPTSKVWRIEEDDSVPIGGLEIISPVAPIDVALNQYLPTILEYIKEIGNTKTELGENKKTCGLHINISHKNKSFTENFDLIKFILFFEENIGKNLFNDRKDNEFCKEIYSVLTDKLKSNYKTVIKKILTKELNYFKRYLPEADKYFGINWKYIGDDRRSQRIEIRWAGGSDYEYKEDIIKQMIGKIAFCLSISFDEEKRKDDYLKKLFRIIKTDKKTNSLETRLKRFKKAK